jgi:hypothetical protein
MFTWSRECAIIAPLMRSLVRIGAPILLAALVIKLGSFGTLVSCLVGGIGFMGFLTWMALD